MKKSNFILTATGMLMIAITTGCSSPSQKVESAQENLKEANMELNRAQKDSAADYELFKRESEERIDNNEKAIAAFKARMVTDKKQVKEADQKIIDELEQRNINMRKKIEEYRESGKDNWGTFKVEFAHDMDELGSAIKGLTINNTN
jgi:phosphoenolpyruvate-protein kinase (PTS system EI component)